MSQTDSAAVPSWLHGRNVIDCAELRSWAAGAVDKEHGGRPSKMLMDAWRAALFESAFSNGQPPANSHGFAVIEACAYRVELDARYADELDR